MKVPSNNLHQLIKSMSSAEKRYFKIHFYRKGNKLSLLYDFLVKMNVYDEQKVKQHFATDKLSANLKVYKRLLYDLLLKSLMSHREPIHSVQNILKGLDEVIVLEEKGLFAEVRRRLDKLANIAQDNNLGEYRFLILKFRIRFMQRTEHYWRRTDAEAFDEAMVHSLELHDLLQQSRNRLQRDTFSLKLAHYINNQQLKDQDKMELREMLESPELLEESCFDQGEKRDNVQLLRAAMHTALEEYEEAKQLYLGFLNLAMQKYPKLDLGCRQMFVGAVINLLHCEIRLKDFEQAEDWLIRAKKIVNNTPTLHGYLLKLFEYEAAMYLERGLFDRLHVLKKALDKRFDIGVDSKLKSMKMLDYQYTMLDLVERKFESCLQKLHRLNQDAVLAEEVPGSLRMMQLICYYELGDHRAMRNLLKKPFLPLNTLQSNLENAFNEVLINPLETLPIWRKAFEQLEPQTLVENERSESLIQFWLNTKATGQTYQEAISHTLKRKRSKLEAQRSKLKVRVEH